MGKKKIKATPNFTFKLPMIRRVFPSLISSKIIGVQAMSAPVGLAYAMRMGVIEICCLCESSRPVSKELFRVDLALNRIIKDVFTACEDGEYLICDKCYDLTQVKIGLLTVVDPKELPLFISDSNIFIKEKAAQLLKSYEEK